MPEQDGYEDERVKREREGKKGVSKRERKRGREGGKERRENEWKEGREEGTKEERGYEERKEGRDEEKKVGLKSEIRCKTMVKILYIQSSQRTRIISPCERTYVHDQVQNTSGSAPRH